MKQKFKIIIYLIFIIFSTQYTFAESSFSGERLKNAIINYINKLVNNENINDIEVIFNKDIQNYQFSQDNVQAKFDVNLRSLKGNTFIAIEFFKNDVLIKRVEYPIRIKIYSMVPVSTRKIGRGDIVKEQDIILEKRDVSIYNNNEILLIEDIIGNQANQNIMLNSIITTNHIKINDSGIQRGDIVNVVSRSGAVSVSVKGVALSDASIGKQIRVKCDSRKGSSAQVLIGVVESSNIVSINN